MTPVFYVLLCACHRRMGDIGNWQKVMDATTVIAVTTNCMLFALSSEQLMQWMPKWYLDSEG